MIKDIRCHRCGNYCETGECFSCEAIVACERAQRFLRQSRHDSFMEAVCNTLIGFWISVAANYAILPLFGYTPKFIDSISIAALFTIVSLVRSYVLRRLFNGRSVWVAIKSRWS